MVRGKNIFFCSCLDWRTNYLWLWIQTSDPSRFDFSAFVILFLSSYFVVSKWWPIPEWNKSYFFPLVNFDSSWTAGAKLLLSGRVTYHITWPESHRSQNGRRLSLKKIGKKLYFAHYIVNLLIYDSLTQEECIGTKKRKEEKFGASYPLS